VVMSWVAARQRGVLETAEEVCLVGISGVIIAAVTTCEQLVFECFLRARRVDRWEVISMHGRCARECSASDSRVFR